MKKLSFIIAFLAMTGISYAQTNTFPSTGNVGIGTTSPTDFLMLNAGANRKGITIASDGDAAAYTDLTLIINSSGSVAAGQPLAWDISHRKDGYFSGTLNGNSSLEFYAYLQGGAYYAPLSFKPDGNVVLVSNRNALGGNVGIGITSPNGKLDVNGAVLLPGSVNNTMSRPAVGSARVTGEIAGYSGAGLAADDGFLRLSAGGGATPAIKSFIDLSGYSTVPDMAENIILGTSGTERVRVTSNGNVGIGTTDPKGYKLAVNGSAVATSMTVKLNSNWPDYVFKMDYPLPSLTEVKTYIDQNQRLPDMPSETEVAKDGINLGKMNILLTKKVEELTLYLIEQNKQIAAQQKAMEAQQKQIDKLNKKFSTLTKTQN